MSGGRFASIKTYPRYLLVAKTIFKYNTLVGVGTEFVGTIRHEIIKLKSSFFVVVHDLERI